MEVMKEIASIPPGHLALLPLDVFQLQFPQRGAF